MAQEGRDTSKATHISSCCRESCICLHSLSLICQQKIALSWREGLGQFHWGAAAIMANLGCKPGQAYGDGWDNGTQSFEMPSSSLLYIFNFFLLSRRLNREFKAFENTSNMTYVQVNRCRSSILLGWGWSFCKSELQLLSGQMVQLGKMALQVHKASFMVGGCSCVVASCSGFVCVTTLLVAVVMARLAWSYMGIFGILDTFPQLSWPLQSEKSHGGWNLMRLETLILIDVFMCRCTQGCWDVHI